ncbi:hypothetical protein BSM4216_0730 [Bacillus smithii]|nr:hypothetical protein BSM4216_0730 [Bacillus smithii]
MDLFPMIRKNPFLSRLAFLYYNLVKVLETGGCADCLLIFQKNCQQERF